MVESLQTLAKTKINQIFITSICNGDMDQLAQVLSMLVFDLSDNVKLDLNHCVDRRNGYTAIAKAAEMGCTEIVEFLIEQDADVERKTKADLSPLALAAQNGHLKTSELLMAAVADIDQRLIGGHTALTLASIHGHASVVEALILAGSQVSDFYFHCFKKLNRLRNLSNIF
jgi:ankyrin repeat protein